MILPFSKYEGAGNDFILIDDRRLTFPMSAAPIARLCHHKLGIGADGLILLQPSTKADFRMRIFNSDGGEAAMCGNGLRCLTQFLHQLEKKQAFVIESGSGLHDCCISAGGARVAMGEPRKIHQKMALALQSGPILVDVIDTGVPHAVAFVSELATLDVDHIGREIRHHALFAPQGVNVTFGCVEGAHLRIRTYERGVEAETLACGTGALAAAASGLSRFQLTLPLKVAVASGDLLEIHVSEKGNGLDLHGPVKHVFNGYISIGD